MILSSINNDNSTKLKINTVKLNYKTNNSGLNFINKDKKSIHFINKFKKLKNSSVTKLINYKMLLNSSKIKRMTLFLN